MESLQKEQKSIPRFFLILLGIAVAIFLVLTGYWWVRFEGLYKIIAEFQLRLMDVYYPFSTAIFTFGILFLTVTLPLLIIRLVFFPAQRGTQMHTLHIRTFHPNDWLNQHYYEVVGIGLISVGIFVGMYFIIRGAFAGSLRPFDIQEIYNDVSPPTNFIEISGYPLFTQTITVSEKNFIEHYAPFVPREPFEGTIKLIISWEGELDFPNASPRLPLAIFENDGRQKIKGVLSKNLAGFPRSLLKEKGVAISEDTLVVKLSETPGSLIGLGVFVFFAASGIGIICMWIGRRKSKKVGIREVFGGLN